MATIPAHNPRIPFLGLLPNALHHGFMIRIKGYMPPHAQRFNVNLQCGPVLNPLDDVALHLSVRPLENVIVRNHHQNRIWGTEECYGSCPIHPGQHYEMLILAENACFKIAINGNHFCEFNHRMPMAMARFVSIGGDTSVSFINIEGDVSHGTPSAPPYLPVGIPHHPGMPPHIPGYGQQPPPYNPPYGQPMNQQIYPNVYNPNQALSYGGSPYPPPSSNSQQNMLTSAKNAITSMFSNNSSMPRNSGAFTNRFRPPPPAVILQQQQSQQPPFQSFYHQPMMQQQQTATDPNYMGNPSYGQPQYMNQEFVGQKKKSNKALKYGAAAAGVGIGALALGSAFGSFGSDSD